MKFIKVIRREIRLRNEGREIRAVHAVQLPPALGGEFLWQRPNNHFKRHGSVPQTTWPDLLLL